MPAWFAALFGAVIGGSAAVISQIVTQWRIGLREDRDKLRAACMEFAEAAFRFVQRVEVTLMAFDRSAREQQVQPASEQVQVQSYRLMMEAGVAQDQLTTAFCKVTMLRHANPFVDDGEMLYKELMRMPSGTGREPGRTVEDAMARSEESRVGQ